MAPFFQQNGDEPTYDTEYVLRIMATGTGISWVTTIGVIAVVLIARKLWSDYVFNKTYKFPAKVPGVPFFGNTFQMPLGHQGPWAKKQAEKYGEMCATSQSDCHEFMKSLRPVHRFTCRVGSNTWVFLNSSRVVSDLMEKRSAIYSSRPAFPMASDVLSGGFRMLLMPYGDRWRAIRKVMHTILNKTSAGRYVPFQELESKQLLYDYLHTPDKWFIANQRFANSVIMSVVFGKRMELEDPNSRELFETANELISALQPGANLVDAFYFLDRLPRPLKWWVPRGKRLFKKTIK